MAVCLGGCEGPPSAVSPPPPAGEPSGPGPRPRRTAGGRWVSSAWGRGGRGGCDAVPQRLEGVRPPPPGQLPRALCLTPLSPTGRAAQSQCPGAEQRGSSRAPPPECPGKGGSWPGQSRPQPRPGALPVPFQGTGAPCQDNGDAGHTERLPRDGRGTRAGISGQRRRGALRSCVPIRVGPLCPPLLCLPLPSPLPRLGRAESSRADRPS